jgi:signal transduction histidine kinase
MFTEHTVLVVDDEPANGRAVSRALADECRVLAAESGNDALALMAREPIALVIADQRMPGMSGAEFLAETVTCHPEVIRVVLTGYADVDTAIEAINRGHVYHFMSKPWEARELRQVVRRGLERFDAAAERTRLQRELRAACARARREAEQQTRLLALTAHELGTPLHILLNVLALLREAALPVAAASWVDAAERATEWLVGGVAQMHEAARLREERLPLRPVLLPLAPVLDQAIAHLRAAACERRLDIGVGECADELVVHADPRWLRHSVDALLSNAVRFTDDGGHVRASADASDSTVDITIADTGIGIAPEHLADVFEPFSGAGGDLLLHGSGRFAFGARGLGLGLASVRRIAEAHGGAVLAASAPGSGSVFTIRLPRPSASG